MENLGRNEIFCIATKCDLLSYKNLSLCNKRFYKIYCDTYYWFFKLNKDFGVIEKDLPLYGKEVKEKYILTYQLSKLKVLKKKNIHTVKFLNFSYLGIDTIPKNIHYCDNTTMIILSYNKLKFFPLDICKLENLTFLDLMYNEIEYIPKEIANLQKLEILDVTGNKLVSLPSEIENMRSLRTLFVNFNTKINMVLEFS